MNQRGQVWILLLVIALLGILVFSKLYLPGSLNPKEQATTPGQLADYPRPSATPSLGESSPYPSDPQSVAESFYTQYIDCLNKAIPSQCDYQKSRYLSQTLIQSLTREYQSCGSSPGCDHGDLILCAENVPDKGIKVDPPSVKGLQADLTLHTFYSGSGDLPIRIGLQKIKDQWQITTISCTKS